MEVQRLAFVQGMADTRAALARWNAAPGRVAGGWALGALGIAGVLLAAVAVIGSLVTPDPWPLRLPGVNAPAGPADVAQVLVRNGMVLLLHALACVAGFIAGRSLPLQTPHQRGAVRRLHEVAGPAAMTFVAAATAFSLLTQALVLGRTAADLGLQLGVPPVVVVLSALPHALPELVALFLPLAAWIGASRRGAWDELLAATVATTLLALPVLVASASLEVHGWPRLLRLLSPLL